MVWGLAVLGLLGQPLYAQVPDTISARVVDARTGEPLAGVEVVTQGSREILVTDANGRFSFEGPTDRPITVYFRLLGHQELEVEVAPGDRPEEVALEALLFELEPIEVAVNPSAIDPSRASGSSARTISRFDIVQSLGTSFHLGDVLRRHAPSLRVRETNSALTNPLGREICLEFRGAAARSAGSGELCRSPLIVVDGVRMGAETTLLQTLPLDDIAEVEVLPPSDAGVRFGPDGADGAINIRTLRGEMGSGSGGFNWQLDPQGHPTWKVFAGTTLGYAAGLAAGVAIGQRCLSQGFNHKIETSCETGGTLGSVTAMVLIPSMTAALGARIAGTTDLSRGRFAPSVIGAAATIAPAYLFLSLGGSADGMEILGASILAVGVPLTVTFVDKLFRRLR
jgi:hypothetical protein